MEERAMASGAPLLPCTLCGAVPGMPDRQADGWRIVCPICGREALGETEDAVRGRWADMMAVHKPKPGSREVGLIDSAVELMCEVESIRTIPGAMDVWHRWLDCANELKRLIETSSQTASRTEGDEE